MLTRPDRRRVGKELRVGEAVELNGMLGVDKFLVYDMASSRKES